MKKRIAVVLTAIIMSVACLTGCQSATKNYGGKTTVKLEPNQKLEEITWKDDSLWYLTRPMTDDDVAETHTFRQQRGEIVKGTATTTDKWQTCTFTAE